MSTQRQHLYSAIQTIIQNSTSNYSFTYPFLQWLNGFCLVYYVILCYVSPDPKVNFPLRDQRGGGGGGAWTISDVLPDSSSIHTL